jgi:hypothetical protein
VTVSRDTTAGRAYLDLRAKARAERRAFPSLLTLYALEGFLGRLSDSGDRDTFVLKGGVLLAAFDARRPTKDIDFLGLDLDNDAETVRERLGAVAARPRDDGLVLVREQIRAQVIRDEDEYAGVRVHLVYSLASAKIPFHVDVNVGDPVYPEPQDVDMPCLLGGSIRLRGYSLTAALAEKIVTAMQRGAANTRWRDYADVLMLSREHSPGGDDLHGALTTVAAHRRLALTPLATLLEDYPDVAQTRWARWRANQETREALPDSFRDVLTWVAAFADPASTGEASGKSWDPSRGGWL